MGEKGFWVFAFFVCLVSVCIFTHPPPAGAESEIGGMSVHWVWGILLSAIMLPLVMLYVRFMFTQQKADLNELRNIMDKKLEKMENSFRSDLKELNREAKERDNDLKKCMILKADVATLDRTNAENREAHQNIWKRVHGHKHDEKGFVVVSVVE